MWDILWRSGKESFLLCLESGRKWRRVSAWKSGTKPRIETISKIADYFGVSTDYLLGNKEVKEKPAADGSELLARLSDPKFRELVQILSTASDKDLDLLIELVRRIDIGKQDAPLCACAHLTIHSIFSSRLQSGLRSPIVAPRKGSVD